MTTFNRRASRRFYSNPTINLAVDRILVPMNLGRTESDRRIPPSRKYLIIRNRNSVSHVNRKPIHIHAISSINNIMQRSLGRRSPQNTTQVSPIRPTSNMKRIYDRRIQLSIHILIKTRSRRKRRNRYIRINTHQKGNPSSNRTKTKLRQGNIMRMNRIELPKNDDNTQKQHHKTYKHPTQPKQRQHKESQATTNQIHHQDQTDTSQYQT